VKSRNLSWWGLPQQVRFLIAGAYNTVFGYLVFAVLYVSLGRRVGYLVVGMLAYLLSLVSAFAVHRYLVFRSTDSLPKTFLRFNLSQIVALGCGLVGLYILVEFAHFRPLLAQALVITMSVIVTYVLHNHYSFRTRSD